jgi:hypothetical protein
MSRKMQKFVDLLEGKTVAFGRPAGDRRNARWLTDLGQGSLIPQKRWALGRPDVRSRGECG